MSKPLNPRRSRLKLLALMAIFAAPMMVAWGMVEWRVGIPDSRTAHGELEPAVPALVEWPLATRPQVDDDWVLAFDCTRQCERLADQWWRLHRALGREAPRVTRLRIGGVGRTLPGERLAEWRTTPTWQSPGRLWVLDPRGQAVLTYAPEADPRQVLDDVSRLLRMNPRP
ncbi:hypothetical protein EQG41_17485 [Billgrantia azerbaijanica]|nr:hypothetical protein EQG41_17485 [Halomonas azerbaijanica]